MYEIAVLVPGYATSEPDGRMRAGGTITLIRGGPTIIVDTGGPDQLEALVDAMAEHRLSFADVDFVVNTHGHLDHIGNNGRFPDATFILDSDIGRRGEYRTHDFGQGSLRIGSQMDGPSITVIATPGHTEHDLSVIVETAAGTVAIVGDLFEHDGDWEDRSWVQWSRHPTMQQESRDRILATADFIIPGHGTTFRVATNRADRFGP